MKAKEEMGERMKKKEDLASVGVVACNLPLQLNSQPPADPSLVAAKHPSSLFSNISISVSSRSHLEKVSILAIQV